MTLAHPVPEERRCQAVISDGHPTKAGQHCSRRVVNGEDYCYHHGPGGVPPDYRRCNGRYSRGHPTHPQERCRQVVMKGQTVCISHGGKAPQNLKAAERRVAEADLQQKLTKQLAKLDVDPIGDPLTALSQLAGQVVAFKDALADRVNTLSEIRYQGAAGEQVRAEITLYERAMDRANTVLGNIARLNIDERLARVTEKQAETVIAAIEAALLHAGITGERATEAKRVAARKLRSV